MQQDPWKYRRRFLLAYTSFVLAMTGWIIFKESDTAVAETFISVSWPSLAALVGAYVIGATWEMRPAQAVQNTVVQPYPVSAMGPMAPVRVNPEDK